MGFGGGGFGAGRGSGSGDSLWENHGSNTVKPTEAARDSITLVEDDADSEMTPAAAVIFQNNGLANNPKLAIGNPYLAGIGEPAQGVWYTDDSLAGDEYPWKICFSWESTGTFASVLQDVERSAFESFGSHGQYQPWMRIDMSSRSINFGSSVQAAAGEVSRTANVVTVGPTTARHLFSVGDELYYTLARQGGDTDDLAVFGAESTVGPSFTVSAVDDAYTFRYADAGADGVSAGAICYSKETDVSFGRDETGVAAVRVEGSTVAQFNAAGMTMPSGLVITGTNSLDLGADGVGVLELTNAMVHVEDGKLFYNQGLSKEVVWYNGGGVTQSLSNFIVGTGSGNKAITLMVIPADGYILRTMNHGEGGANTLTINAGVGNTINGAASYVVAANAGVTLISTGTDWRIFYHPAPP